MPTRRSLAAVFAHPDDDTWGLGGTYAASGDLDLTVVVATSGEAGLIADPALATREELAEVREVRRMRGRGEEVGPDAPSMPPGVPDETITTRVDTSAHVDRKWAALQAHATQADEMQAMSDEERQTALATECFIRVWPPVTD